MKRRDFLTLSGLGVAHGMLGGCALVGGPGPRRGLVAQLVAQNDARIAGLLARQQRDPKHPGCGGVPDTHGLYRAGSGSGLVRDLAVAYVAPGGVYRGSSTLLAPLAAAARFMLACQHADGTIDLLTTNFHSTPDVGFVVEWIASATGLLRSANDPALAPILADLDRFLLRGATALTVGGIHTPNHRWVVAMALARVHALHPDPRYLARIDQWLGEKVDIDPDGQFTERSTSVYSPLTDRWLITMARLLKRPELYAPARRNLAMTLYYVHADGEVATEGSRRQDRGQRGQLARYYYSYRYLALHDRDGRFAAMTRWIESLALPRLTSNLVYFLEDPTLARPLPPDAELPTDFARGFVHSKLARIRRGDLSATILAESPTILSLHKGGAAVALRCAAAFFGKGQFVGDALRREGDAWVMRQELRGPYYQPLPAALLPGDGNWDRMPKDRRPQSEVQVQHATVTIREERGGLRVDIDIRGTDGVPVAIELGFRQGGGLRGVEPVGDTASAFLLRGGSGRYRLGDDVIEFAVEDASRGRADHRYTQVRGALPKLAADSVYVTGFTPFGARLWLG